MEGSFDGGHRCQGNLSFNVFKHSFFVGDVTTGAKRGRPPAAPGYPGTAAGGGSVALSGAAGVAAGMVGKLATLVGDDPRSMELQ